MVRSSPLPSSQFSQKHGHSSTRRRRQLIPNQMERQRKQSRLSKICLGSARHPERQNFKHCWTGATRPQRELEPALLNV